MCPTRSPIGCQSTKPKKYKAPAPEGGRDYQRSEVVDIMQAGAGNMTSPKGGTMTASKIAATLIDGSFGVPVGHRQLMVRGAPLSDRLHLPLREAHA